MRKLLLTVAGLALIASPVFAGKFNKVISVGEKAPTFSAIPIITADNKEASLSLSDIKEDVVVLVFLANHCPVVIKCEDRIIDFTNDYKGKNVKVVAMSVSKMQQDNLDGIKQHAKAKGYNFDYGYDESQAIGKAYGATNTPQFFVLDKDRVIRYTGAMDDNANDASGVSKQYLRPAVDALLKGESVELSETKAVGCGISYR